MAEVPVEEIGKLAAVAVAAAAAAGSRQELEAVRVRYLGREGKLTGVLRAIGKLPAEVRPKAGQEANRARAAVEDAIEKRRDELAAAEAAGRAGDQLDVTLPGLGPATSRPAAE